VGKQAAEGLQDVTPARPLEARFLTEEWAVRRAKVNADLARLSQQQAQERADKREADPMTRAAKEGE
jgi:hypothetical protein